MNATKQIAGTCKCKEQVLLKKNCNIVTEAAKERPESIGKFATQATSAKLMTYWEQGIL